jgi:hypothetical protein
MALKTAPVALIFILMISQTTLVSAQSPGDYHQKFWGGGLHVWLSYPEEASPGDDLDIEIHIISGKFPRGNQVEEVKAKIAVLTDTASVTLYDDTIIQNTYLPSGDTFTQSITVTIPSDSRWFVTIQMDTVSYQQDGTNRQEAHVTLDSTQVRDSTYQDLEYQIDELQAYSNQLGQQINLLMEQMGSMEGDNQTITLNSTCLEAYAELHEAYDTLMAEQEDRNAMLAALEEELGATIEEKEAYIEELEGEIEQLSKETARLFEEKEAVEAELNEYIEAHETETPDNSTRNMLIVTNLVTLVAAIAIFYRLRNS